MAWTEADLETVRKCIAAGVRKVNYSDGAMVEYQNADQMLAVERVISSQLSLQAQAMKGAVRRKYAAFSSGF